MLEPKPLTSLQQDLYDQIARYNRVTGEPCPASHLARRFDRDHSTIQDHISALYRKGWLHGPNSPAKARRWLRKPPSTPAKSAVPRTLRDSDTPQP
jgi:DNA-binding MarR family transcriptional regulator